MKKKKLRLQNASKPLTQEVMFPDHTPVFRHVLEEDPISW